MRLLVGYFAFLGDAPQHLRLFLATGILAGYTTFSAFLLDAALLLERGQWWLATGYVLAAVLASIGGFALGVSLIRHIT